MPRHSQDQDPAASAVEKNEKCRCSRHAAFLGCLADAATNTSLLQVAEATKFREIFTFFKTATCPQSYHLQAALRILISSYEKITTVTHKQLFIKVHVHAQKSPWTNHWQPLDCGLIIRWSCFKLPLYFPIILDVTHKLFWLLSVVNMNFVLFPTSFDTHIFKCWLPQYL